MILCASPEHVRWPPKRVMRDSLALPFAEADVATAIASGHSLKEVALLRTCSVNNTVRTLVSRVLDKTAVGGRPKSCALLGALNVCAYRCGRPGVGDSARC